jgi:hypothetical protein
MKSVVTLTVLIAGGLLASACHPAGDGSEAAGAPAASVKSVVADKSFASGGKIDVQLDGGAYEIRPSADGHIRVTFTGNVGNARTEVSGSDTDGKVQVTDTPRNFRATIEVPAAADLVVHLKGGELVMEPITGNKEVQSYGGDIRIGVGNPDDYSSVDASVKAGDIDARPFGGSKSGLLQTFTWSGHGKYTLRADLGAGNLVLRSK